MSTASKAKVFVSSTIYDFRDLRSALKLWLEELGCEVMMSEHSDFPRNVRTNSYDACLQAIDHCDYFVLFIGARVGGLFGHEPGVSITRAEYRRAYKNSQTGHTKLILFVRKELWDIREDRKALANLLEEDNGLSREVPLPARKKLIKHPSKFVVDAEITFSFLEEIARTTEMRSAIRGRTPRPTGNWITPFESFSDVVSTLRMALGFEGNLRKRAFEVSLREEIRTNTRRLLRSRKDGRVTRTDELWLDFRDDFLTALNRDFMSESDIPKEMMNSFAADCVIGKPFFQTTILDAAIQSGEFLTFDRSTRALVAGPVQSALIALRSAHYDFEHASDTLARADNMISKYARDRSAPKLTRVKNLDLIAPFGWLDSRTNLLERLVATCAILDDRPAAPIEALGPTVLSAFDVPIRKEVSSVAAEAWLTGRRAPRGKSSAAGDKK